MVTFFSGWNVNILLCALVRPSNQNILYIVMIEGENILQHAYSNTPNSKIRDVNWIQQHWADADLGVLIVINRLAN